MPAGCSGVGNSTTGGGRAGAEERVAYPARQRKRAKFGTTLASQHVSELDEKNATWSFQGSRKERGYRHNAENPIVAKTKDAKRHKRDGRVHAVHSTNTIEAVQPRRLERAGSPKKATVVPSISKPRTHRSYVSNRHPAR